MTTHTCFGNPCPICFDVPAVDANNLRVDVERLKRENAKLRHAVHMEVGEAGYTYDNALAEALRDLADAKKRADNEVYSHKVTAEMLGGATAEVDRLRQRLKRIEQQIAVVAQWSDDPSSYAEHINFRMLVALQAIREALAIAQEKS